MLDAVLDQGKATQGGGKAWGSARKVDLRQGGYGQQQQGHPTRVFPSATPAHPSVQSSSLREPELL